MGLRPRVPHHVSIKRANAVDAFSLTSNQHHPAISGKPFYVRRKNDCQSSRLNEPEPALGTYLRAHN